MADTPVSSTPSLTTTPAISRTSSTIPARPDYSRLNPTADDIFAPIPQRPDYAEAHRGPPPGPRPSDGWLKNPAWIDGAQDPPLFFYSHEEIMARLRYYNPDHPSLRNTTPPLPPPSQAPPPSYTIAAAVVDLGSDEDPGGNARRVETEGLSKHQITATMLYIAVEKANPATRSRAAAKKQKSSKLGYVRIEAVDRCSFVKEFLKLHDLSESYSPGVHSGPPFKLSWTGSPGGKGGAITIDTNQDYDLARGAILMRSKRTCHLTVEFDIDEMNGYRISNKRPIEQDDDDDEGVELAYGTKVPRLDGYTAQEQIQGNIVLELKKKWVCERHQGEHGEAGYCYIDAAGSHLGLNHRKLSLWAAAIAAHDATKHEPPNTVDFDGLRDGRLSAVKGRGRTGPRVATSDSTPNDAMSLAMAAVMPILASLVPKPSADNPPSTPVRRNKPNTQSARTPSQRPHLLSPFSPVPDEPVKIHVCLNDFFEQRGVDLRSYESLLLSLDFTPDVLPTIPVARLCEIMDITEGCGWKFSAFVQQWNERLEFKKHH